MTGKHFVDHECMREHVLNGELPALFMDGQLTDMDIYSHWEPCRVRMEVPMIARTALLLMVIATVVHAHEPESIYSPSMTRLLVEPDAYLGKKVSIFGYLHGEALYLTRDHAEFMDSSSLLLIADEASHTIEEACGNRYVMATGRLTRLRGVSSLAEMAFVEQAGAMSFCWERKDSQSAED